MLVAATRWGAPLDVVVALLAPWLGAAEYDARLRLAGPLPVVVASGLAETAARELLRRLREAGHGAVACEEGDLPVPERSIVPRSFEFTAAAFVGLDAKARRYPVSYADLLAIVHAAWIQDTRTTTAIVERKLSLGLAVMTGGLMRSKSVERVEHAASSEREEVLYLFRGAGPDPMVLRAGALGYDGLGAYRGMTVRESFGTVLEWLRRHAPTAIYDDRLFAQPRRPGFGEARGGSERVEQSSNTEGTTLAAFLLVHAHLQGQL